MIRVRLRRPQTATIGRRPRYSSVSVRSCRRARCAIGRPTAVGSIGHWRPTVAACRLVIACSLPGWQRHSCSALPYPLRRPAFPIRGELSSRHVSSAYCACFSLRCWNVQSIVLVTSASHHTASTTGDGSSMTSS